MAEKPTGRQFDAARLNEDEPEGVQVTATGDGLDIEIKPKRLSAEDIAAVTGEPAPSLPGIDEKDIGNVNEAEPIETNFGPVIAGGVEGVLARAERIYTDPPPDDEKEGLQAEYQEAVLADQVTVGVIAATYATYMDESDRMIAYTRDCCEKGTEEWKKYFKLRGLAQHVPAKVTQLLALLKMPELFTEYWVEVDDDSGARVWCYVYAKREDFAWEKDEHSETGFYLDQHGQRIPAGNYLARDAKSVPSSSNDYLEKAITGARQRALKQLGFGTAAGIAALEDVENVDKTPAGPITAPTPPAASQEPQNPPQEEFEPPRKREQLYREGNEAEKFLRWQREKKERLAAAQAKFRAYLEKRSKVFTVDEVERKYGSVDKMERDELVRVFTELEKWRSRGKWLEAFEIAGDPEHWKKWRDWAGGTEKEQVLSYLQTIHDALKEDDSERRRLVSETQAAVHSIQDDLALMPAEQQIDALLQGVLPAIGDGVDLGGLEG